MRVLRGGDLVAVPLGSIPCAHHGDHLRYALDPDLSSATHPKAKHRRRHSPNLVARHHVRNAAQESAAAVARSLYGYRACHRQTARLLSGNRAWCRETKAAIRRLAGHDDGGDEHPARSATAAVLEDLIAFERRNFDVADAWLSVRRPLEADDSLLPFLRPQDDALAEELNALEAGLPLLAMMPHVLTSGA